MFFSSSVVDVIKREINDKFQIFDMDNVFYIHGLRKQLSSKGKQGKVKKIIADYFTTPNIENEIVNSQFSSLWKLQNLRNQAMHGHVTTLRNGEVELTYTVRSKGRTSSFTESDENPQRYFRKMHNDTKSFVMRVRDII